MAISSKTLCEVAKSAGYETRWYSGRGMYGRNCVGIEVSDGGAAFQLGAKLAVEAQELLGEEEAMNFQSDLINLRVSTDAMGQDTIVYFPDVAWVENEAEVWDKKFFGPESDTSEVVFGGSRLDCEQHLSTLSQETMPDGALRYTIVVLDRV